MRKIDDGGKKDNIMLKIVATNNVACQLPEHRPNGTPTTHAVKQAPSNKTSFASIYDFSHWRIYDIPQASSPWKF